MSGHFSSITHFLRRLKPLSLHGDASEDLESGRQRDHAQPLQREPLDLTFTNRNEMMQQFLSLGYPDFESMEQALQQLECRETPAEGSLAVSRAGASSRFSLAIHSSARDKRTDGLGHLLVVKTQPLKRNFDRFAKEVLILSSLVHENIIGFYGCFTVSPSDQACILLQHADAGLFLSPLSPAELLLTTASPSGDLNDEMSRFLPGRMPESGAKFYAQQIASGLKYLHSRGIRHCDLHAGSVLLRHNADRKTRTPMIADFGCASVNEGTRYMRSDVWDLCRLVAAMLDIGFVSEKARMVIRLAEDRDFPPDSVSDLLALPWFQSTGTPPVARYTPVYLAGWQRIPSVSSCRNAKRNSETHATWMARVRVTLSRLPIGVLRWNLIRLTAATADN